MFNDDFTINRRKWHREATQLPAQYFIKKQSTRYMDCTIVNLSRGGAGVLFPKDDRVPQGSSIFIDVVVPKSFEQLTLRGAIRRVRPEQGGNYGGIQFESLLPEIMLAKLLPP